jgi:twitching motility protein PilT
MDPQSTRQLLYSILTEAQKHKFEEEQELDLSFGIKGLARFRANIFVQRGAVAGVFRLIPYDIVPLESLGLPNAIGRLTTLPRGLILVTGPTGSGKSTTLASFLDKINTERRDHIVTIEDPIEFVHKHKGCIVNQREVGSDTKNFTNALKYILRQDPDVVFIGEMRDLETMQAALTIAETGHLVFATLHTNSAVQTVNRVVDAFPAHQQSQIRAQMSFVLEAVISQQLLPRADGKGRVLAAELMISTPAIRNLIREDKIHQIYSQMQVGQGKHGMQTMNQALFALFTRKLISLDDAMGWSMDPEELRQMMASPNQSRGMSPNR